MAFPAGWNRRVAITIDHTKVSASQTGFPVLLTEDNFPSEIFDADGSSPAQNGGGDLRFSSDESGTTQLPCEVVSFVTDNDPANGTAEVWVKTDLSSSTDTVIYCWYNTAGTESQPVASDTFGSEQVWNSGYKAIWHMNQDPSGSAPQILDSTSNDVDATSQGSMTSGDLVSGKIGDCLAFDGTDDYLDVNNFLLNTESVATVMGWIWLDNFSNQYSLLGTFNGHNRWQTFIRTDGTVDTIIGDGSSSNDATNDGTKMTTGSWHHVAIVASSTNLTRYLNGVQVGTNNSRTVGNLSITHDFFIGAYNNAGSTVEQEITGKIDELSVHDVDRSADWILTTYNNQNSPSTFASAGTPTSSAATASVSPVVIQITIPAVTATYQAVVQASVSPVALEVTIPAVTATSAVVAQATVTPVQIAVTIPSVTATALAPATASVSPVQIQLTVPSVTAIGSTEDVTYRPGRKQFITKIFSQDGRTLQKAFTSEKPLSGPFIKNDITFRSQINGGFGECMLDIEYPFDDFSEGAVIDYMNIVQIYVVNATYPKGKLIYTGFISSYEPYIEGDSEGVRVTALGLVSLLSFSYYKNGSNFTVTHSGDDPQTIGRAVIDHFNTVYGGSLLSYNNGTTDAVGQTVNLTFEDEKWIDCLKKSGEVTDDGWWWKIDEAGRYWLKPKPASTHTFTIMKDVVALRARKDGEKVVNDVQVRGDSVTSNDTDSTSQATHGTGSPATGKRSKIISDSSLKNQDATDQRAAKEIADAKDAKIAVTLEVNSQYNLESIKVGQCCMIRNFKHASTVFGSDPLQIVSVTYKGDSAILELEQIRTFGQQLQNIIA